MERQKIINFQARIYNLLPNWLQRPTNNMRILTRYLHWCVSPHGRRHALSVLSPLHNRFRACRCVVIGNGPSLSKMDLSVLRDEFTFGLNRIYILFDELGFETSFLVVVNGLVLRQYSDQIRSINILKFLNWFHRQNYQLDDKTVFLSPRPGIKLDGRVINGFLGGTGTVTNLALELAFFMGFSEVVLIGVDHSYAENGIPGEAIVAKTEDQNHFSPEYFGPGTVWQLPNYKAMEFGYQLAKDLFEQNNRCIVDATLNGKLQIFPKVNFEQYLATSQFSNKLSFSGQTMGAHEKYE